MSLLELECQVPGCSWKTPSLDPAVGIRMLQLHVDGVHAASVNSDGGSLAVSKAEKVPRPVVKMDMGEDDYLYFESRWESYKRATGLKDAQLIRDQLLAACSEDLSRDLFRLVGSAIQLLTEEKLLKKIKELAVRPQNNLINVVKLLGLEQERDEPIKNFLARLKGAANVCKLTVKCTAQECREDVSYSDQVVLHALVRGLADEEIREEVLASCEEKSLDDTVKLVEAKEAGRRSAKHLGASDLASSEVNKMTAYKKEQSQQVKDQQKCDYCGKKGHGNMVIERIRVQHGIKSAIIVKQKGILRGVKHVRRNLSSPMKSK